MGCGSCAEIWRPCGALRMFVLVVYMGLPLSIWDCLAGCRLFHGNPQAGKSGPCARNYEL